MATPVEEIVLVDENGAEVGVAEKYASHTSTTPLHRAFSCYIFDDTGRFLVTRRAESKKVWPGVWTNSCCGHPAPKESFEAAIQRRVQFELGATVKDIVLVVPDYTYKTPPFNGIIEHEFCPIYVARLLGTGLQSNPDEVAELQWMSWAEYVTVAQADQNDIYSWWCKDQLRLLAVHAAVLDYAYANTSI